MCQECVNALNMYYPHLTDKEKMELLWGATCFPAGSGTDVVTQIAELRSKTDGSLEMALAFVDEEISREMAQLNISPDPQRG